MTKILNEILKLSETERLLLVEAIWNSIGEKSNVDDISEDQEKVLKSRLASFREEPHHLLSWEEIKSGLK